MKKLFPIIIFMLSLVACDDYGDYNFPVNENILDFINKEYKGASIRETDYSDNGLFEVEVRHDYRTKDVYFDQNDNWVYTIWDVSNLSLPSGVKDIVSETYPGYRIDDADIVESPEGTRYKLEIEKGGLEKTVFVSPVGEMLP